LKEGLGGATLGTEAMAAKAAVNLRVPSRHNRPLAAEGRTARAEGRGSTDQACADEAAVEIART